MMENRWWQKWDSDDERKKIEAYWRHAADQPERRRHFYRVLANEVRAYPTGIKLLDFGCGTGEDTGAMLALGVDYHGADVTPTMLAQARARFPSISFEADDMLGSKYGTGSWPIVVCNAVLPHLPADRVATAIRELWRLAGKLLIVRLFGVDTEKGDKTVVLDGFIYQRWASAHWTKMFQVHTDGASKIRVYAGQASTADCLIICCQR
jgi:2-polyprenyl-3-methyl-5-hydroxy-6-metoxy-1,4-benzoquinol methylase